MAAVRSSRGEKILEIDGTVTTQPVLEHVGVSTWPGKRAKKKNIYQPCFLSSCPTKLLYILSDKVGVCIVYP